MRIRRTTFELGVAVQVPSMPKNIAIVGSGFLGMTLALRLAKSGVKVTLFESAGEIGGLGSASRIGDVSWDKDRHVTLLSDTYTQNLLEELGLANECRWVEAKTGLYTDGEPVSMSNTVEVLKGHPLGLVSKLRLGAAIFIASRIKDRKKLESTSVEKWLVRLSGPKAFGKVRCSPSLKKQIFGHIRGGYVRILERFAEVLAREGVEIRLNWPVHTVEKIGNGKLRVTPRQARRRTDPKPPQRTKYARVKTAFAVMPGFSGGFLAEPELKINGVFDFPRNGLADTFDSVVLTCPSNVAAKLAPQLSRAETQNLENPVILCASNSSHDLPSMKTSVEGLYIVNTSHTINGMLNVNETIQLAEKFLEQDLTTSRKYPGQTE